MKRLSRLALSSITALGLAFALTSPAHAQEDDFDPDRTDWSDDSADGETPTDGADGLDAPVPEDDAGDGAVDENSPAELPNVDYHFLGLFTRGVVVPSWMIGLFADGGFDATNGAFGATYNYRRNDLTIGVNVWWNNAQGNGYFRAQGDPESDQEYVQTNLNALFINAEILWAFPIADWIAFEIGFDIGLGAVWGSITRTEATRPNDDAPWEVCADEFAGRYCEGRSASGHYGYDEPDWLSGGGKPVVVPWLALPHLAIRIKPIRQIQIRLDGGFGVYNFFFGASAAYGF